MSSSALAPSTTTTTTSSSKKTQSNTTKKNQNDQSNELIDMNNNNNSNNTSTTSTTTITPTCVNSPITSNNVTTQINNSNNSLNQGSFIINRKDSRSNDKFHQLFPTIPIYETVLLTYSCAFIKSFNLLHGIMFLTSNYICFYSKVFAHETILVFKWKDVISITKINYMLLFPTAIRIDTTHSTYVFTTFRSRTQTYDALFEIWNVSQKKRNEISKTKPNDVLECLRLQQLEAERNELIKRKQDDIDTMTNDDDDEANEINDQKTINNNIDGNNLSLNNKNEYYCRTNYDISRNYYFYDLNFSDLSNKRTVIVSIRHKKSILQKAKVLLGCLIPGFFNISRIDALLPICFLMCILLLLNAFVLLHKVNQVDELFTHLLKPI